MSTVQQRTDMTGARRNIVCVCAVILLRCFASRDGRTAELGELLRLCGQLESSRRFWVYRELCAVVGDGLPGKRRDPVRRHVLF